MPEEDKRLKILKKELDKDNSEAPKVDLDAVQNIVSKIKDKDRAKGVSGNISETHMKELRDIISEGKLAKLNVDTEAKLLANSTSELDKGAVKIYKAVPGFINYIVKSIIKKSIGRKIAFYLYSADIKKTLVQHLVLSVIYSLLVTFFIGILTLGIIAIINPLFLIIWPFIVIFIFLMAVGGFAYLVPMQKAKTRGVMIDTELPYVLRHISTELQAGIGLYKTLQSVAKNDYGVLSQEMSRTIMEIENGTDTKTALRHMALRSQSKSFNIAIFHIVRTLNTGGNLSQSIDSVADSVSFDLLEASKQFGEKMNFFGIIFIFVAIVLPVFLAILSAIANAPIGQGGELFLPGILTPTLLAVVYVVVMPAIFVFIAYYIKMIEPKT
ncbi:MAG TPA: type II secretion system F family protein [archaeon]|jgi:flagellar protein FlaJ|nr:type II secretion system F family protein [archaeon]HPV66076.1 type II secretion system F family protein [archaeon]